MKRTNQPVGWRAINRKRSRIIGPDEAIKIIKQKYPDAIISEVVSRFGFSAWLNEDDEQTQRSY